jgi:hypothetical protein
MKKKITVPCGHCKGCGRIELSGEYLATFERLRSLGTEATGAELGPLMGVQATAMNNRLAALERLGLVASRRHGRMRLFSVKGK